MSARDEWKAEQRDSKKIHDSITPWHIRAGSRRIECPADKWTVVPIMARKGGRIARDDLGGGAIFGDGDE